MASDKTRQVDGDVKSFVVETDRRQNPHCSRRRLSSCSPTKTRFSSAARVRMLVKTTNNHFHMHRKPSQRLFGCWAKPQRAMTGGASAVSLGMKLTTSQCTPAQPSRRPP